MHRTTATVPVRSKAAAQIAVIYTVIGVVASVAVLRIAHIAAGRWVTVLLWFGAPVVVAAVITAAVSADRDDPEEDLETAASPQTSPDI